MEKNYFIGLDIGTNSVGWAVSDENYELIKARGRNLFGSYLFDEAQTAESRRMQRTSRRRIARTRQRLMLLQELFAEEIYKVDPTFFLRLNDSKLHLEDKDGLIRTKNVLFNDSMYGDKAFYKDYPTIFHLRSSLLKDAAKDIRLLYLAVHHIIKNRGHFLFENQNFEVGDRDTALNALETINVVLSEKEQETFNADFGVVVSILCDTKKGKSDKQYELKKLAGKTKQTTALINALTGGTFQLAALYDDEDLEGKYSFSSQSFDEKDLSEIERVIGYDDAELVRKLKVVYDWSVLYGILSGEKYISIAKVKSYEKHKKDLLELKKFVKANCPEKYLYVFRKTPQKDDDKENGGGKKLLPNYAAYIGKDGRKGFAKCSKEAFYDFLKKKVICENETEEAKKILLELENGTFLNKQMSNVNGVIPYQAHLSELKTILSNAEKKFPFLKNSSDSLTVSEKIVKLMTFRIPYYVGPLNDAHKKFSWVKKFPGTEKERVTPWNFDRIVDKDASESQFILRMTNKCTYLVGEDVLPANSLLYSEFTLLNELNNLRVFGEKSEVVKAHILDYAKKHKKLTLKQLGNSLQAANIITKSGKKENFDFNTVFSGSDGDFKSSLSSYIDLKNIIGDKVDTQSQMCERIIFLITVVSDKERLRKQITKEFSELLTEDEIKRVSRLNYSGWGRLSRKLLTDIKCSECCDTNGELLSIIEAMRIGTENFMQLLSYKHGYLRAIETHNLQNDPQTGVTYKTVQESYCSPSVKRAIWRSICLVREITEITGKSPLKIMIETAKPKTDETKKVRTNSSKQQLLNLYANIKGEKRDWKKEIEQTPDTKFNSKKLVLYYLQMGKSMVSGRPIPIESVFDINSCDIDHIYPQSKIKDDSLDNLELVFKEENSLKGDVYPLSPEVQNKIRPFWEILKSKNLISQEKFYRLTRTTALSAEELTNFINRQLVETRQSTKIAAELLSRMLPDTKIIYTKAGNANGFKEKFEIVKVRELNDLHHAKDAYINIVVGNIYYETFGKNAANYFKTHNKDSYNLKHIFEKEIDGVWKFQDKDRIVKIAKRNDCAVVRFTSEGKGQLFNATIKTAGENDRLIPLKQYGAVSNTAKYGGYDSATTKYFTLVKSYDKKGKAQISLECITIYADYKINQDQEKLSTYLADELNLIKPQILIPVIKLNTLFCINGSYANIRGRTGNQIVWCNANQLFLDDDNTRYLKQISNWKRDKDTYRNKNLALPDKITDEKNLTLYNALVDKLSSKTYAGLNISGQAVFLREKREAFKSLTLTEQCEVVWEILHFMQCNSATSDLRLLGGTAVSGKILTGKVLLTEKNARADSYTIILQSPTSFYRKTINISEFL